MTLTRDQLVVGGTYRSAIGATVTVVHIGETSFAFTRQDGEVYSARINAALTNWSPAPPPKPEWLNDMWVNVYPCGGAIVAKTASGADCAAADNRIGRVNLSTGEWVPCRGKEVLGS